MQQAIKLAELLKSQRGDAARIIGGERSNVKGHISSPRLLLFTAYLVVSSCVFFFHLYICLYGRQLFISNCSGRRGGVGDGNPKHVRARTLWHTLQLSLTGFTGFTGYGYIHIYHIYIYMECVDAALEHQTDPHRRKVNGEMETRTWPEVFQLGAKNPASR